MTKIELLGNKNYAITVIAVGEPHDLQGLDNLVGVSIYGLQALTTRGIKAGDLRLLFVSEAQIGERYAHENDLNRKAEFNKTDETGFLEQNRRVRAIKLRKHTSNALLMPLSSLAYTGLDVSMLRVGDTFDTVGGETIVQKYELPKKQQPGQPKAKHRTSVEEKHFPQHIDTEHLFRNWSRFTEPVQAVVTQKLHGTSARYGRVPVPRSKSWLERKIINRWFKTPDTEFGHVAGSRRVIKGQPGNQHFYSTDVWSEYGKRLEGVIPENCVVYGELVGFTPDGEAIQKGYTYNQKPGECELFVYRVAFVNAQGVIADLSWDGVKEFCRSAGLRHTPELERLYLRPSDELEEYLKHVYLDVRLSEGDEFEEAPIPLSDPKTVDEGICVRVEGVVPHIYKVKSPQFLEHETRQLDSEVPDLESVA